MVVINDECCPICQGIYSYFLLHSISLQLH
jgi:hypothetical protein